MSATGQGILESKEYRKYGLLLDAECLKMFDDPELKVTSVVNREYAVRKLNDGVFHKLLMRYESNNGEQLWVGADQHAVYLGVYSMERGVTIGKDDMEILSSAVKRVELHPEAKEQVEKALTHYESNGDGWNFENKPTSYNPDPNSGLHADEMKKEDQDLQNFLKRHNAYTEEKAAREEGSGD